VNRSNRVSSFTRALSASSPATQGERPAADLIERALADDVIRESEERLRLITKTAPIMIWITDAEGQVTYLNQMYLDFTGLTLAAALGQGWMNVPHPDDLERCIDVYMKAADRREPFQIEHRLRRHDGEYRWVISTGVPRSAKDGSFAGYSGTALDITERKLAEEVLATVSQRLIEAQEEERARLGRELHDDINQRLVTLGCRLGILAHRIPDSEAALRHTIEDLNNDVRNLVNDIQALSYGLHPPQLEYLGIAAAAASLCREVSDQQDVKVSFHAESVPQAIPQRISLCVYRVLQESLQNAIKHSGARHVEVSLCGGVDQLTLTVHDSGVGFDPDEAVKANGLGLTSMKERLKAVQGQLYVDSKPQCGTTIRACVPLFSTDVKNGWIVGQFRSVTGST